MKTSNTIIIIVIAFSLLSVAAAETWEIEEMIVSIDAPDEVGIKESFDLNVSITAPLLGIVTINPFLAMQVEPEHLKIKGKSGNLRKTFTGSEGFDYEGTPVLYDYSDLYVSGSDYGYNWRSIPAVYENGYKFARLTDNLPVGWKTVDWKTGDYTFAIFEDNIIWTYSFSGLSIDEPGTYDFSMIINGHLYRDSFSLIPPVGYGWLGESTVIIPCMAAYDPDPLVLTHLMTAKNSELKASVDINPNVLNLKSNGNWITGLIEIPDPSLINVSSIVLNDNIHAETANVKIGDYDNDGQPELEVNFNRSAVISTITSLGTFDVKITGKLLDGTPFEGWDTIMVKNEPSPVGQMSGQSKGKSR